WSYLHAYGGRARRSSVNHHRNSVGTVPPQRCVGICGIGWRRIQSVQGIDIVRSAPAIYLAITVQVGKIVIERTVLLEHEYDVVQCRTVRGSGDGNGNRNGSGSAITSASVSCSGTRRRSSGSSRSFEAHAARHENDNNNSDQKTKHARKHR